MTEPPSPRGLFLASYYAPDCALEEPPVRPEETIHPCMIVCTIAGREDY